MIDALYEIQIGTVARLKGYPAVTALIGTKVFDDVPLDAAGNVPVANFPYVSFGPGQVLPDNFECITGSEIYLQLDAWSREPGFAEVRKIANAVRLALHGYDLPLTENALVSLEYDGRRDMRDPDGKTSHSAITFKAVVEHD